MIIDASAVATRLVQRGETIAVCESSAGGLISAALLAVPGASAYFLGGGVLYTRQSMQVLLDLGAPVMAGYKSATEPAALLLAQTIRRRFAASWGLAETGAAGPAGNRYGHAAGHSCLAISGPVERAITLETASADRPANMLAFAQAARDLLAAALG
jgi:PncC family amidohydrolase